MKEVLSRVKELMESEEFIGRHKTQKRGFTRKRKLSAQEVLMFVLTLKGTTQPFEILRFLKETKQEAVAPGSMTKARKKISYEAFREILQVSRGEAAGRQKFKGYDLVAVDGMEGELPRTKELLEKYSPEEGSRIPKFHAVSAYDVQDKVFLDAEFLPFPCDERGAAMSLIKSLELDGHTIMIFDRGFPSIRLLQLLEERGIPYVMRCSSSFLKEVNSFTKSEATDEIIDIHYTKERAAKSGSECNCPWDSRIRAVKIPLQPSGQEEILLTSLVDMQMEDLAEVYRLRWGIETSHNYLKNAIVIESFMGTLENSIKQEFYAALFTYNISSLLCKQAEVLPQKKLQI